MSLSDTFANHPFDVEAAGFARDLGVHNDQQQKIAKFLAKVRVVVRARAASPTSYASSITAGSNDSFVCSRSHGQPPGLRNLATMSQSFAKSSVICDR